jgi:hypothetical protein
MWVVSGPSRHSSTYWIIGPTFMKIQLKVYDRITFFSSKVYSSFLSWRKWKILRWHQFQYSNSKEILKGTEYFQPTLKEMKASSWDQLALCVSACVTAPSNFWMPEPVCMKLCMYTITRKPIKMAHFMNPFINNTNITGSQNVDQPWRGSNVTRRLKAGKEELKEALICNSPVNTFTPRRIYMQQ